MVDWLPPLTHWLLSEPNVRWCEAHHTRGVLEPANTLSSLPYVAVGLAVLADPRGRGLLKGYGPVGIVVGLTSAAYHATWTVGGQLLDYIGMFTLTGWLITLTAVRAGGLVKERATASVAGWVGSFMAMMVRLMGLQLPAQPLIMSQAAVILYPELSLPEGVRGAQRPLHAAIVCMSLASLLSISDATRL